MQKIVIKKFNDMKVIDEVNYQCLSFLIKYREKNVCKNYKMNNI
jgi:hypothetical protein